MNPNNEKLRQTYYELLEFKLVLLKEMLPQLSNKDGLRYISGMICKSKALTFERMLFRTTRGNMFFNQAPAEGHIVEDPVSGEMVEKTIFEVFFSGEQARTKNLKICDSFWANCYLVPVDSNKQRKVTRECPKQEDSHSSAIFMLLFIEEILLRGETAIPILFVKLKAYSLAKLEMFKKD